MMKMQDRESARSPRRRDPDRRSALLAALGAAGRPLNVAEVAAAIGTAEPTARFHLSLLVSSGQVVRTADRRSSAGRPSWRYAPAPVADASAPDTSDAYEALARVLAGTLDAEAGAAAAAREAGRRWADAVPAGSLQPADDPEAALASLASLLDGLGFAPDPAPSADEIVLRACPFESVARDHRAVVCGVHLGLAEEAARSIGGGIAVDALESFRSDQPLACGLRLRRTG